MEYPSATVALVSKGLGDGGWEFLYEGRYVLLHRLLINMSKYTGEHLLTIADTLYMF
jgi:hypothetical protein